jgi:hypothetical protein
MNRKISVSGWNLIGSNLIFGVVIYELITGEIVTKYKSNMIDRVNQPIEFCIVVGIKSIAALAFAYSGITGIREDTKPK